MTQFGLLFSRILNYPLRWLTKSTVVPKDPFDDLKLDSQHAICYVMNIDSGANLTILERECHRLGLPSPTQPLEALNSEQPCYLSLNKPKSWFNHDRTLPEHQLRLQTMLEYVQNNPEHDIQLIPVSMFWGRNPGKEKSFVRVLFTDQEDMGRLRRLLAVLVNGRQNFISFNKPISLQNWVSTVRKSSADPKKLARTLRLHFHRQRVASMGPTFTHLSTISNAILASQAVKDAIQHEATKRKIPLSKANHTAKDYVKEIACTPSFATLRFFDKLLTWLWNKLYDGLEVGHTERLREIAQGHEIIYVPSHRSHIDYLLLSYVLYYHGLIPPHIAAGINLDFWPVGGLLRRAGAFFIRRSFRGNQLYTTVFNEYVNFLFRRGIPVEYFIEGGRSRTGRLLEPKTGMLAMTVQNYVRSAKKPLVMVPVYVGYERVMEVSSYQRELLGAAKQKESIGQLVNTRKALRTAFGKVYVNFGSPILLSDFLQQQHPSWRQDKENLAWTKPVIHNLAQQCVTGINNAVAVNSVALVSLILLTQPRHALVKGFLKSHIKGYINLFRLAPYSIDMTFPNLSPMEMLDHCERLSVTGTIANPLGDIVQLVAKTAVYTTYYRNNILHIFALPALIASCYLKHETLSLSRIQQMCHTLYPYLKAELFIRWDAAQLDEAIQVILQGLVQINWLQKTAEDEYSVSEHSENHAHLLMLAATLQQTLERYFIALNRLLSATPAADDDNKINKGQLANDCKLFAEQKSVLYGINSPEFFDKSLFMAFYQTHEKQIVTEHSSTELYHQVSELLPAQISQTLEQSMAG